eukprot:TRINITY_DN38738_c0_g1_i1.p1 TRINITY_DN38738_c0_g1~~TRINITY_DN38738_c0_g1_i1.p1  ORF type:complete len:265 (+),score=54.00 TRINITY_DN38738_c0_g1_i1:107-901(+)
MEEGIKNVKEDVDDVEDAFHSMFQEPSGYHRPRAPPSIALHHRSAPETGEPSILRLHLVGHHSLWAHHLWNASVALAHYFDRPGVSYEGKSVLELGAGAGLPSLILTLRGAERVLITDYPESVLLDTLRENVHENIPSERINCVKVMGFLWGSNPHTLLHDGSFDLILLSDLVFNHSQHEALLRVCHACLAPGGVVYVAFSHHRPHYQHKDREILTLAASAPFFFRVEQLFEEKMPEMFPEDPGDVEIRRTVYCFTLRGDECKG